MNKEKIIEKVSDKYLGNGKSLFYVDNFVELVLYIIELNDRKCKHDESCDKCNQDT